MGRSKFTIKDIAKRAGVGVGTVSRVLNNNPNVKGTTRERVLKITSELHYVPNGAARMLVSRNRSLSMVGLLVPLLENQFFYEILKALHDRLKKENFNLMIFNTEEEYESAVNHIVEHQMAGMIVLGDRPLSEKDRSLLRSHRLPYLHVDYYGEGINFVRYDNYQGGRLAADYLMGRGCRNVILIGEAETSLQQKDRFRGFADRVNSVHYPLVYSEINIPNGSETYGLSKRLMNDPDLDGIFYFSDEMAYGGIQAKRDMDSQVSLIGYDDIFPTKFLNLSTINQSSRRLGTEAAEGIMELIGNRDHEGVTVQRVFMPELIDRGS